MSDLIHDKYHIMPAGITAPPPSPIGADIEGGPISHVISGGKDNVWTIHKLENGNFTLTLQSGGGPRWLSKSLGDDVVVEIMPLPGEWGIRKQEDNTYSIEVPSGIRPTRAWTLESTVPGTKVKLRIYELPTPHQLWRFTPFVG